MANPIERWFDNKRLGSLSPFREFERTFEPMDRMLADFMKMRPTTVEEFNFSPSCEISEVGSDYVLKVDLPGVAKDQVKVEVDQDQLTISAERREEKETETNKKYLSEVCYGSYTRSFTLPGTVDEKKIDAKFENGVLTVKVPKTASPKAKQISIH